MNLLQRLFDTPHPTAGLAAWTFIFAVVEARKEPSVPIFKVLLHALACWHFRGELLVFESTLPADGGHPVVEVQLIPLTHFGREGLAGPGAGGFFDFVDQLERLAPADRGIRILAAARDWPPRPINPSNLCGRVRFSNGIAKSFELADSPNSARFREALHSIFPGTSKPGM